jgi:hypothetical protein
MSKPGIYFITVKRRVYDLKDDVLAEIVSNTLAVTVIPYSTSHPGRNREKKKQESEYIEMVVETEEREFVSDENIYIYMTVRNKTNKNFYLRDTYPSRDYRFEVYDEGGNVVPMTENGIHLANSNTLWRNGAIMMPPGKEVQHSTTISKLFDMSKPGIYFITVKRRVHDMDGKLYAEIVSNTLAVTVIPKVR